MKTLKEYRAEVLEQQANPTYLANLSLQLGADLAYYQEQYGEREIEKAEFMESEEGSVASKEYRFLTTDEGKQWQRLKRKIKGIDGLQKGLTNINISNHQAAKNQI